MATLYDINKFINDCRSIAIALSRTDLLEDLVKKYNIASDPRNLRIFSDHIVTIITSKKTKEIFIKLTHAEDPIIWFENNKLFYRVELLSKNIKRLDEHIQILKTFAPVITEGKGDSVTCLRRE